MHAGVADDARVAGRQHVMVAKNNAGGAPAPHQGGDAERHEAGIER